MRSSRAADRGILPLDSSGTLEIGGIHVDVGGPDAQTRALCGLAHRPAAGLSRAVGENAQCCRSQQAPNLPDGTLDQIVSSINVEREEIGPNRYIADLGVAVRPGPRGASSSASKAAGPSVRSRCC